MKILNAEQIRNVDAFTIEHEPIKSIDLMERAATACFVWIMDNVRDCLNLKIFAGPGNNGGDGLAIARMMAESSDVIEVFLLTSPEKLSADARINYDRLRGIKNIRVFFLDEEKKLPQIDEHDVVIDALFGSGLSRPLTGLAAKVVKHVNKAEVTVVAIDLPSGLHAEANTYDDPEAIIKASHTLTFQVPKLAFFFSENAKYVGHWHILDIELTEGAIDQQGSKYQLIQNEDIAFNLNARSKFSHKGTYGHALLMAGSYGKMGAAVLASKACLRTGVGLFSVHIVSKGYEIIQTTVPEAMVSIDPYTDYLSTAPELDKYNAVGIGPGIGTNDCTGFMLQKLLTSANIPLVLDADALNLISSHPEWLGMLPANSILTPHPGEFDRLAGTSGNGYERHKKQIQLSQQYKIIIILKGAHTSITDPDGNCWFNSTGNPGMATAGSGDVLTGIVLSLLAQGYQPLRAALTGVYLHGLAGDLACQDTGVEALLSSDIINYIGKAFMTIRSNELDLK